jgi:hypothetical protein
VGRLLELMTAGGTHQPWADALAWRRRRGRSWAVAAPAYHRVLRNSDTPAGTAVVGSRRLVLQHLGMRPAASHVVAEVASVPIPVVEPAEGTRPGVVVMDTAACPPWGTSGTARRSSTA